MDKTSIQQAAGVPASRRPIGRPHHAAAGVARGGDARAEGRGGMARLWHFATEYLLALPLGAAIAMIWANVSPESYFPTAFGLEFIVNDVAMVFFFALMTKEIVDATAPGGVLHTWRRLLLPVAAAAGASLSAAGLFAVISRLGDETRVIQGWPAVLAVDLAVVYFLARALFGRHPVVPFALLVAIAANAFGFLGITVVHPPDRLHVEFLVPLLGAAAIVLVSLRRVRVKSFWPYVLAGGTLSWCALFFGGFEPAFALVPVVPFLPHAPRAHGFFVDARPGDRDALNRFELWIRHPAQVALFLFGLVAAGVPLRALETGTWSLPLAMLLGRPAGLMLGVAAGVAAGLHLSDRIGFRHLVVVGFIAAIGFTMTLFFATATVGPGPVLSELKMGALLTLGAAVPAIAAAWLLKVGRFAPDAA